MILVVVFLEFMLMYRIALTLVMENTGKSILIHQNFIYQSFTLNMILSCDVSFRKSHCKSKET